MKILVIGPSWVGDMVMSQSLYKAIKANHPDSELHVMAPAWCGALLERMPEVDKAIPMPLGHGDFKLGPAAGSASSWRPRSTIRPSSSPTP